MRRRGAFSVIELIVVVATVALLLGLLLPALASIRAASRSTLCMSNLRQMGIAAQGYALEYQFFPAGIRYENQGVWTNIAWDWVTTADSEIVSPGPLWAFANNPGKVQQCPDYHGETNFPDPFTGYNYNTTYIGGESRFPQTGWSSFRPGVRYSACRRVAQVAIFGDGGWAGGTSKFMRAPLDSEGLGLPVAYSGGQAFRHQRATNVAYLDGHVDSVFYPQRGALANETLLRQHMGYPQNGFLSNDDDAYDPR